MGSALRALVGWLLLVLGLYMLAAVVGSLIPVNADWEPPEKGYAVYIYDNGVHTSLIFKRRVDGMDLGVFVADPPLVSSDEVGLFTLPDARFPGSIEEFPFIMIGWGDARFYRETPTWGDVRPGTAFAALFGSGEELVHVDRLRHIPYRNVRRLILRQDEFIRLVEFIANFFPDAFHGRAEKGYGSDDRFFTIPPRGQGLNYSALFTCNNWVSEALKTAGVKTGKWTPLPFGVMWWHEDASAKTPH